MDKKIKGSRQGWELILGGLLALWVGVAAHGQEALEPVVDPAVPVQLEELPPPPLPTIANLAEALADPAMSEDVMLTLAALAQVRTHARRNPDLDDAALANSFLSDREWLESLVTAQGVVDPRSSVLDPAAWQVQQQLDRYDLQSSYLASTLGPGLEVILEQSMSREDELLAASVVAELKWHLEASGTLIWDAFLRRQSTRPGLWSAIHDAAPELFTGWPAPLLEPEDQAGEQDVTWELISALEWLRAIGLQVPVSGPPDSKGLSMIRSTLLRIMPQLGYGDRMLAESGIHLTRLLEGLYDAKYVAFTKGLLALLAQHEQDRSIYPGQVSRFVTLLGEILPGVSEYFSREFARVDPRINTAIASSFDVARTLSRPALGDDAEQVRKSLADSVARLALLVPDMGYYFDLPVRDRIAGDVDACTGIVAARDPDGSPALTRELFDDCQQTLVDRANGLARASQLAGDPDGPFGPNQLRRELSLTSGQRINYGIGFLHDQFATGCEPPARPLPNPLEWAYLATFMAWLAEQSPVYFRTPENERRLNEMRAIGRELTLALSEQVDCMAGAGAVINDPVNRLSARYREQLRILSSKLQDVEFEFREQFLQPGADVDLSGDADQSTAYRPGELSIGPCNPEAVCEMTGSLSSTRALVGLFPEEYLLADQSRLGRVEICYDNMGWEDRRSEPVRPGDENVANYFGHLSFDLKGRFVRRDDVQDLFAFHFRSPEEYHYMFAAASEEVLADACPVEWIGSKIVTPLPQDRGGIVPNRLTYLSAPRTLPSRLLGQNWEDGAEWRDWFVTGIGVQTLETGVPEDIRPALLKQMQLLYRLQQRAIYGSLLQRKPEELERELTNLFPDLQRLGTSKSLVRTQMALFYPALLSQSDELRMAMAGHGGLLDVQVLRRMRDAEIPVSGIVDEAYGRLDSFDQEWGTLTESVRRKGSVSDAVSHAMVRLNAIQQQYFAEQPAVEELPFVAPLPGSESEGDEVENTEADEEG